MWVGDRKLSWYQNLGGCLRESYMRKWFWTDLKPDEAWKTVFSNGCILKVTFDDTALVRLMELEREMVRTPAFGCWVVSYTGLPSVAGRVHRHCLGMVRILASSQLSRHRQYYTVCEKQLFCVFCGLEELCQVWENKPRLCHSHVLWVNSVNSGLQTRRTFSSKEGSDSMDRWLAAGKM